MQPIEKTLRNQLRAELVCEARDVAEAAAISALRQLGVDNSEPPAII